MKKPSLKFTTLSVGIIAVLSVPVEGLADRLLIQDTPYGLGKAQPQTNPNQAVVKQALIKEPQHKIYHVIKNKTLVEAANQIAERGRVIFKIDPALKADIIDKKLAGDTWHEVLKQLLDGYNYTTVSEKGVITTIFVTGHHGDGGVGQGNNGNAQAQPEAKNDVLIIGPVKNAKLPSQYLSYAPGSVMSVSVPMQALGKVAVGENVVLDLPIGQYTVQHDNVVDHGAGNSTWVGYLSEEGQGYRVYLSQGKAGVMGSIFTPDGEYTIDTVNGKTLLVDMGKSGLEHAGFDGDEMEPMAAAMDDAAYLAGQGMAAGAASTTLSGLKASLENATTALATFKQQNPWLVPFLDSNELVYKDQTDINTITASIKLHKTELADVKANYSKVPKTEPIPELSAKIADWQNLIKTEQANLKALALAYQANVKSGNASIAALNKLLATANAALKKAAKTDDTSALKSQIASLMASVKSGQASLKAMAADYQVTVKAINAKIASYNKEIATAQAALKKAPPTAMSVELNTQIASLQQTVKDEQAALSKLVAANAADVKTTTGIKTDLFKQYGKTAQDALNASAVLVNNVHATQKAYDLELAKSNVTTPDATTADNTLKTTVSTPSGNGPIVDLMVLYTTDTQTADYAKQRVQYLVDIANQAYKDSGINMTLNLIHARPTKSTASATIQNIKENSSNSVTLSALAADAGVKTLRAQYGADLVMLFKPLYANTSGSCGVAYLPTANAAGTLNDSSYNGYSVVNDGTSKDANKSYCDTITLAHEVGHGLGNTHDREYSTTSGVFSYSYAWGIKNSFGTIMSYNRPAIALFASPLLANQCKGGPCGFPEGNAKSSDQVRTTNAVAPQVANYFATKLTTPDIQ